jgi:hypothetical protein
MIDISKHPILTKCYEVMLAIEECGCNEKVTEASLKADELLNQIDKLINNKDL